MKVELEVAVHASHGTSTHETHKSRLARTAEHLLPHANIARLIRAHFHAPRRRAPSRPSTASNAQPRQVVAVVRSVRRSMMQANHRYGSTGLRNVSAVELHCYQQTHADYPGRHPSVHSSFLPKNISASQLRYRFYHLSVALSGLRDLLLIAIPVPSIPLGAPPEPANGRSATELLSARRTEVRRTLKVTPNVIGTSQSEPPLSRSLTVILLRMPSQHHSKTGS